MQKHRKGRLQNEAPFWRERGTVGDGGKLIPLYLDTGKHASWLHSDLYQALIRTWIPFLKKFYEFLEQKICIPEL